MIVHDTDDTAKAEKVCQELDSSPSNEFTRMGHSNFTGGIISQGFVHIEISLFFLAACGQIYS